jgi:preprotein translocase subunit SecD
MRRHLGWRLVAVGTALTVLFLLAWYRLLGGLAGVALAYGLLSFAALLALDATLTHPGGRGRAATFHEVARPG